jgi:hypothetical protein
MLSGYTTVKKITNKTPPQTKGLSRDDFLICSSLMFLTLFGLT